MRALSLSTLLLIAVVTPRHLVAQQEIDLAYTNQSILKWDTTGVLGFRNAGFWAPAIPTGSLRSFGQVAKEGFSRPPGMVIGTPLNASAFAPPVGFNLIWQDTGSGAADDVCMWEPVPPPGYVSLGTVAINCNTFTRPSPLSVTCVRRDLVVPATIGERIYDSEGSGAHTDFAAWDIVAPPGAIDVGTFIGSTTFVRPTAPVYCLKADRVVPLAPPAGLLGGLISQFGPKVRLHPNELFTPDNPAEILVHPSTRLVWSTIQNPGSPTFSETILGTSGRTGFNSILDDVQAALSHPNAAQPDFVYRLDWDRAAFQRGGAGLLSRERAYVRVQPVDGALTELQFWYFYPWTGPEKATGRINSFNPCVFDPAGSLGSRHAAWQSIRIRLTNKNPWNLIGGYELISILLSGHGSEEEIWLGDPRLQFDGSNPIVYAAKDSHANYLTTGTHHYETFATGVGALCRPDPLPPFVDCSNATGVASFYDITADGGRQLDADSNYLLVSSAWPSIQVRPPSWWFFGGLWGAFHRNPRFCISGDVPLPYWLNAGSSEADILCREEVLAAEPGPQRRDATAVASAENADLGVLRIDTGRLTPAFDPSITSYTLDLPESADSFGITALAMEASALVQFQFNGSPPWALPRGPRLGIGTRFTQVPFQQSFGSVTVTARPGLTKRYDLTVRREPAAVTNTSDSGPGSLRDAIQNASSGDLIVFDSALSGQTITLGGTQLTVDRDLAIDGSNLTGGITISGGGTSRIFEIISGADVALIGLNLRDGAADNGGAIKNTNWPSTLTMRSCTVSNNSASNVGGGIYNQYGWVRVENTTIDGNTAGSTGGGIWAVGAVTIVTNATIAGNQAASHAGFANQFGIAVLAHCTVANNVATTQGGGFSHLDSSAGSSDIFNSIIAGNSAASGPDIFKDAGSVVVHGINLIGDNDTVAGEFPVGSPNSNGDFVDVPALLAPLGDYGGPTPTMPPRRASIAIDAAASAFGLSTDQRGRPRYYGGGIDIGAFENQREAIQPETFVLSPADSIQLAIVGAFDGDALELSPGTYGEAIDFAGKAITLRSSGGPAVTILDGAGAAHVVQAVNGEGPGSVLRGFTVTGGNAAAGAGGGFLIDGSSPTVTDCVFAGNTASDGGGMANLGGASPVVTDCVFERNAASDAGGGMLNTGGSNPTVTRCRFVANQGFWGGGMCNELGADATITDCRFLGNTATNAGGGICCSGSSFTAMNCTLLGNGYGAVYLAYASTRATITNCTVGYNRGTPGLWTDFGPQATVTNSIFWGCTISGLDPFSVNYCNVQGGWTDPSGLSVGNIDADPLFVDLDGDDDVLGTIDDDVRLRLHSPCVDAGDNASVPTGVTTDLAGGPRLLDDRCAPDTGNGMAPVVDMGAYERPDDFAASATPDPACPPGHHQLGGPVLSVSGPPTLGSIVTLTGSNLVGTSLSSLLIGDPSAPIPLTLIGSAIPGAALCVSPWLSRNTTGGPWSDINLPIAMDPVFCGFQMTVQWLDYAGTGLDFGSSRALRLTVGR